MAYSDWGFRRFRFGRADGTTISAELVLMPNGKIHGYRHPNETSWAIEEEHLVFKNGAGAISTRFDSCRIEDGRLLLSGQFLFTKHEIVHTLREIKSTHDGILAELLAELYCGESPYLSANPAYVDGGYPHTNLSDSLIEIVLDVIGPRVWLEIGSMLGGSAIRTANVIKKRSLATDVICIDPFTGSADMWEWERPAAAARQWRFLRIEHGRLTVYERFLANVRAADHHDIILPITTTSIVGLALLRRLFDQRRITLLPEVIYLDSAHEPGETLLELQQSWSLLNSGILMGDDWDWEAVRTDVITFAKTARINTTLARQLASREPHFVNRDGILLYRGQWILAK